MFFVMLALLTVSILFAACFLAKRGLITGAVSTVVFYVILVVWAYFVFELDIVHLGLDQAGTYGSFESYLMSIPEAAVYALRAVVAVVSMTLALTVLLTIRIIYRLTRAVLSAVRRAKTFKENHRPVRVIGIAVSISEQDIFRLNCRMNC